MYDILTFGASIDELNTEAIQQAIDAAASDGGGTVVVPAGEFLTGALFLKSNVELHLSAGAVLKFSDDPKDYPVVHSRWEGVHRKVYASCIYAQNVENISVTGFGTLDGNGKKWWHTFRNEPDNLAYPRPKLMSFHNCHRITVKDIKLIQSPSWTINPILCSNATFDNLTILNPADSPNTDGIDGLFYLVYTDVKSAGRPFKDVHNYLITASEITGPWSEPIYLNSNGFDPSLFHDLETGKKWLVNELWDYRLDTPNKSSGIVLQEYDAEKKKLDGPIYKIFAGTELAKTEAPHLYFRNGYYYLMTAEGGTGRGHSVTVCLAKNITGPYELDPGFPMLTASDKPASTLQCTGYGSLVQTPSGRWYMTYLCTRPLNGAAILGRETAIQEVYWTSDDWLRLKDSQTTPMEEIMIETNEEVQQEKDHQFMDTFEGELKKNWNAGRILPNADWCDTKCRPSMCRSGRRIYAGTHWLPIVYNRWSHPIIFSTRKDLYDGKLVTSILLICIRNHFASRLPTESFKNCIYW
ncbi:family 43 glycosylhydrolase [Enterococcus faecium]|nr:family 43 glycosylhydrolase [Enterococcus faecium]